MTDLQINTERPQPVAAVQIRVLQLEPSARDAAVELEELQRSGLTFIAKRVDTQDAFIAAIESFQPDVILADDGSALALARASHPEIPMIVVCAMVGDEDAAALLKAGAHDLVYKDRMGRLGPAVDRALHDEQDRRTRVSAARLIEDAECAFYQLFDNQRAACLTADCDGRIRRINRAFTALLGYDELDVNARMLADLSCADDRETARTQTRDIGTRVGFAARFEQHVMHKDGHPVSLSTTLSSSVVAGKTVVVGEFVARTDNRASPDAVPRIDTGAVSGAGSVTSTAVLDQEPFRSALTASERRFVAMSEYVSDLVFVVDANGCITYASPSVRTVTGYDPGDVLGHSMIEFVDSDSAKALVRVFAVIVADPGYIDRSEFRYRYKDGRWRTLRSVAHNLLHNPAIAGVVVNMRDVTEHTLVAHDLLRLRTLVDHAMDAMEIMDGKTLAFLEVNERSCIDLGYSREELLTMNPADIDPAFAQNYTSEVQAELLKSGSVMFETIHQRKDGSTFPVEVSLSRATLDRRYQFSVTRDITSRSQMKKALTESELRFRSLIETTTDIVAIARMDGTITYVSPAVREVGGYEPKALIGRSYFDLLFEDDRAAFRSNMAELAKFPDKPLHMERRLRHKDGSARDMEAVARNLTDRPGINGIVVSLRDVTERKAAEVSLRDKELTLRTITGAVTDAVMMVDSHGAIAFWNEAAERILGYGAKEVMGMDFANLVAPVRQRERFHQFIARIVATGPGHTLTGNNEDEFATRKDGVEVPVEVSATGVMLKGELQVVGVVRDISQRKHQERALARVNRALRALSAGNSAVVHAVSEPALLQQMCHALVDVSGYRMAWVGFAQADVGRTILGVAWAGEFADEVRGATLSWADGDMGRGPVARCIRSGEAQVARDIATDPTMGWWREEAARHGYLSALALPLKDPSRVVGALMIFAGEPDAFDADEMAPLSEMAGDLSYGINALHTRSANEENLRRLERSMDSTVRVLGSMVELRDPYTAGHQRRVACIAVEIGRLLGLSAERLKGLNVGATMHDIGKIVVPAEILSKPGKLSAAEFMLLKEHPGAGADILAGVDFAWPVAEMIRQHHERVDGSGYPRGLKGEQILLEARIIAVADVVEAMSSHRPYRPAKGIEAALAEITRERGSALDADVVDACLKLFHERGYRIPE